MIQASRGKLFSVYSIYHNWNCCYFFNAPSTFIAIIIILCIICKLHPYIVNFFLKKLKSFHVNESILKMFYQALIQSVITFGISCWGGNITEGDKQKINKKRLEK